ncbi:MAG: exodeoxyribonuclease III [bacterium]
MKIASWNINGIRSAHDQLKRFLEDFNIDVLCLQEIKVGRDDIPESLKKIDGYRAYFNPAEKRGYSGTAIYTKIEPDKTENGIGDNKIDREGRVQGIKINDLWIYNFYFPHSSRDLKRLDYKMFFNQKAYGFFKKNLSTNSIFCGDMNVAHSEIDLARPRDNTKNAGFTKDERDFMDKFLSLGLIDVFRHFFPKERKYTWWSNFYNARQRNIGWRIDYFLSKTTVLKKIKKVSIENEVFGSDHCPVIIEINP